MLQQLAQIFSRIFIIWINNNYLANVIFAEVVNGCIRTRSFSQLTAVEYGPWQWITTAGPPVTILVEASNTSNTRSLSALLAVGRHLVSPQILFVHTRSSALFLVEINTSNLSGCSMAIVPIEALTSLSLSNWRAIRAMSATIWAPITSLHGQPAALVDFPSLRLCRRSSHELRNLSPLQKDEQFLLLSTLCLRLLNVLT